MANSITSPVWKLDTTGTIVARGTMVRLRGIAWIGAGTAGDSCVIRDALGNDVWESVASGANFVDRDAPSITINGLVLQTLSSGRVYIESN